MAGGGGAAAGRERWLVGQGMSGAQLQPRALTPLVAALA